MLLIGNVINNMNILTASWMNGRSHYLTLLFVLLTTISFSLWATEKENPANQAFKQLATDEKPGPDYVELIRKWADVTNFAQNASHVAVTKIMRDLEKDNKHQKLITPALKSDLEQFFYELFSSKQFMNELAALYSQYFTLEDMLGLVDFYNTPLGQKIVKSNADLMIKSHEIGSNLLKKNERGYMEIVDKHMKAQKSSK